MNKAENATTMSKEAREARKAYHREWNAKNRDKIREYDRRRWEKKVLEEKIHEALNELQVIEHKPLPTKKLKRKGINYTITDLYKIKPEVYEMLNKIISVIKKSKDDEIDEIIVTASEPGCENELCEICHDLVYIKAARTEANGHYVGCVISTGFTMYKNGACISLEKENVKAIKDYFKETKTEDKWETDLLVYVADKRAETAKQEME